MSAKETLIRLSTRPLLAAESTFRPVDSVSASSILILEYMLPLGCCVHMTPVYEAIKQMNPSSTLTVATRGLGLSVLRNNPRIDHLISTPDPLIATADAAKALRNELARRSIRPSIVLTGASGKRIRIALMALLAVPAARGGFTLQQSLYHKPLEYDPSLSLIDNNLRLLSLLGDTPSHFEPRVYFNSSDIEHAKTLANKISPDDRPIVIFVTQNSGGQRTGWHTDRFAQVIRHAALTRGYAVGYVGTDADREPVEHIRKSADGIGVSVAGSTSVAQLAALLALSDTVVALDTGTMHVGRAVDVPMVVMGPSWQQPLEWLPLGKSNVRILRGPDRKDMPPGYQLDEVQAPAVIAALDELLATYPPSKQERNHRLQKSTSIVSHPINL